MRKLTILLLFLLVLSLVFMSCDPKELGLSLSIEIKGEGATIPEPGTHYYEKDKIVDLEAESFEGWQFKEWQGHVTDTESPTTKIVMDSNQVVVAVFVERPPTYALALESNPIGAGHVEGEGEYSENDLVEVRAAPHEGFSFVEWTEDEVVISKEEILIYTMPGYDVTLVANFKALPLLFKGQGRVLDRNGIPVQGVIMNVRGQDIEEIEIEVDEDGFWEFEPLFGEVVVTPSLELDNTPVPFEPHEQRINIDNPKAHFIAGPLEQSLIVTIQTGEGSVDPPEGAHYGIWGQWVSVTATPDPGWRVDKIVWVAGVAPTEYIGQDSINFPLCSLTGKNWAHVYFEELPPTFDASGSVKDRDDKPVEEVTITAKSPEIGALETKTDELGEWLLEGVSGELVVTPSLELDNTPVPFEPHEQRINIDNPKADFIAGPLEQSLIVTIQTGEGSVDPLEGAHYGIWGQWVSVTATPDPGWRVGKIVWVAGVAPTEYIGQDSINFPLCSLTGKSWAHVYFEELPPTFDASGSVKDRDGEPVEEVTITANGPEIGALETKTDELGEWLLEGVSGELVVTPSLELDNTPVPFEPQEQTITKDNPEAHFLGGPLEQTLTISIASGEGSVEPSEGVHYGSWGDVINIKTTPDPGWRVEKIVLILGMSTIEFTDMDSLYTFLVSLIGKSWVNVYFEPIDENQRLIIAVQEGEGTTNPSPGTHLYPRGTEITVNAIPNTGWEVERITITDSSGTTDVTGYDEITFTLDEPWPFETKVDVFFHELPLGPYKGSGRAEDPGGEPIEKVIITGDGDHIETTQVETDEEGYWEMDNLYGEVVITPSLLINEKPIPSEPESATIHQDNPNAHFVLGPLAQSFEIVVMTEGGTTNPSPGHYTREPTTQNQISWGYPLTVTPIPEQGHRVEKIERDVHDGNPPSIYLNPNQNPATTWSIYPTLTNFFGHTTFRVYFEPIDDTQKLTIAIKRGEGTTNPSPGTHLFPRGSEVTVTANPDPGWAVLKIALTDHNGTTEIIGYDKITFTLDEPWPFETEVHVYFEETQEPYSLDVEIKTPQGENVPGVTITLEGDLIEDQEIITNENGQASAEVVGEVCVTPYGSLDRPIAFDPASYCCSAENNRASFVANLLFYIGIATFRSDTFEQGAGGEVILEPGDSKYYYGDSVHITAIPDEGFAFDRFDVMVERNGAWGFLGSFYSNSITITIEGNMSVTAFFQPIQQN